MTNLYQIPSFFSQLEAILGSNPFLLITFSVAFFIKMYLIIKLLSRKSESIQNNISLLLLVVVLSSAAMADSAWIFKLTRTLFFPSVDYRLLLFWVRITWGFTVIQYHSLALFIESLIRKNNIITLRHKLCIPITTSIAAFFIILAFIQFNTPQYRPNIELQMLKILLAYQLYALLLTSLIATIARLRKVTLPRILKKQLKIFIVTLICPTLIADFINFFPLNILQNLINNRHTLVSIQTILLSFAMIYCIYKVMGLKFLNIQSNIPSTTKFNFIHDFKNILEQLSQVTSVRELGHITQTFFKEAFHVPKQKIQIYIRKTDKIQVNEQNKIVSSKESIVESFIGKEHEYNPISIELLKSKILVADDIEFSNFYEENKTDHNILTFLHDIYAEIFIPIYDKQSLIAYIIIEKHGRDSHLYKKTEFYNHEQKDQMIVFSSYLGNIINLLYNRNLKTLIQKEKDLQEELYNKHQEINQYKESIRSFLRNSKNKKIGIIFYKNRKFILGNQTAKILIPINIHTNLDHPISVALHELSHQVLTYSSPQTKIIKQDLENQLILYGIPGTEKNQMIIIIHHPEITDILNKKIDHLKDPTKWDYLLYLETTQSGKLINNLIPGIGETLLNFKIDLLKTALSKKAILLEIAEKDLMPTVEILHHISLRETLHIMCLQKPTTNFDTAIKLFGINPIFGMNNTEQPLLEKLNKTGTLFIKNINYLDLETQKHLAEFIKYGFYKHFKGEQTIVSSVRIICSTNIDLKNAVQDGTFSKQLFNELNKTSIIMPSLITLPEHEMENLTKELTQQAIQTKQDDCFCQLSENENKKLAHSKPTSLQELKENIQKMLEEKSKQKISVEETTFEPAYSINDPEIIEAARLGKHALRDPDIMAMLWKKFKNQNKIATLLGVNRSSVNRRCKDYNLR